MKVHYVQIRHMHKLQNAKVEQYGQTNVCSISYGHMLCTFDFMLYFVIGSTHHFFVEIFTEQLFFSTSIFGPQPSSILVGYNHIKIKSYFLRYILESKTLGSTLTSIMCKFNTCVNYITQRSNNMDKLYQMDKCCELLSLDLMPYFVIGSFYDHI